MKWCSFVLIPLFLILIPKNLVASDRLPEDRIVDSLLNVYSANKMYDSAMLYPILMAIQHYPELQNTAIEFRRGNIPTLMAARPRLSTLFRKKDKREYLVIISTNPVNKSKQIFRNMSLSAKTGILGHEFAHVLCYEQLSSFQIVLFGIRYLFGKRKIEHETDRVAIERGLGEELLNYTMHIKHSKLTCKKYRKRKRKYYLSVSEIQQVVDAHSPAPIRNN
mgnify:CR=1 FL=1